MKLQLPPSFPDSIAVAGVDDTALECLKLIDQRDSHPSFSRWGLGLLLAVVGAMFLPWQQYVRAAGEVTALTPQDRPQVVPAVIGGRIAEWHVQEGQYVTKGTLLLRLTEVKDAYLDPRTLDRYGEQLSGKERAIGAKEAKARALADQIAALEQGRGLAIEQARNTVSQLEAAVAAATTDSVVADDQLRRRERLAAEGLSALNDLQASRLRFQQSAAKLVEARNQLATARLRVDGVAADYDDKLAKAEADRSATLAEIGEGRAELAKLRNDYANLQIRNGFYEILAPQDGYIVRALRAGVGEQVKEGDPLVTIMPSSPQLAVALRVRGTDLPLITTGRKVRMEFDGWPALQFAGWPSVAVGTFGGVVAVVDRVNGPDGMYRILVTPDPEDEPWPTPLQQGTGVRGWAMLNDVRLGFEIWRQFNGFPPSITPPGGSTATGVAGGAETK